MRRPFFTAVGLLAVDLIAQWPKPVFATELYKADPISLRPLKERISKDVVPPGDGDVPRIRVAQASAEVLSAANPTIAPLKWMGLLINVDAVTRNEKKYSVSCTGQFISPRVLLTAAHCVQSDETGEWYDLNKMYFLLQYQNNEFSQAYRPLCVSRFDDWRPSQVADKSKARWQFDFAMILVDRASSTGFYNWKIDWKGEYSGATAVGYPKALLEGEIIQKAHGNFVQPSQFDVQNVVELEHGNAGLAEGSSGGAWVANLSKEENPNNNVIVSISSFVLQKYPGASFGPYLTSDFQKLFDYVSNGCAQ